MSYDERLHDLLRHFVETLTRDMAMQQVLDEFTHRLIAPLELHGAGVLLMGDDDQVRLGSASDERLARVQQLQIEYDEGPCLEAYRTGRRVLDADLGSGHRFPRFGPRAGREGLRAVFSYPLRHDGQLIGAADLYRRGAGEPTRDDVALGAALVDVAAPFIANALDRLSARDLMDELRVQALHDPLTGLPNRRLLVDRIEHALAARERTAAVPAVLFCDLDDFKRVNDTLGHRTGDHLLQAVAERLVGTVRPGDTVARLGGDEFAIVCGDLHACAEAHAVAERVREGLRRPFRVDGRAIDIAGSIGVACADHHGDNSSDLLDAADRAMYAEKAQSRRARRGRGATRIDGAGAPGTAEFSNR